MIAETAADARDVMVGDGKAVSDPKAGSGLHQIHSKDLRPTYEPSKRRLTWTNGAVASIYNGTEPDQLRGPQHDAAWCDELAKWQYAEEAWDQLQFGLRTGRNPRVCITTTPRPIGLLKDFIKDPSTVVTGGSTFDNRSNLSAKFLSLVQRKYEDSRLGRQQLQEDSNECGIICAALGVDGHGYVLDDVSGVMAPVERATKAIGLYHQRRADRIVAETNSGGEMVEATLIQGCRSDPSGPLRQSHPRRADQRTLQARPHPSRRPILDAQRSDMRLHG